jgi:Mlc titration factor MtfA (ptsG expression regulator)
MIGIVLIVVLIFSGIYVTKSKRKEAVAENNIMINDVILENNIAFYRGLNKEEKIRFEDDLRFFLGYIRITGVNTPVENLDRIFVAASAVIPVFAFPGWKYYNLREVLLYGDAINSDFQTEGAERNILGMVGSGYMEGKMLLSKFALEEGFKNESDKSNTAIHEFAHLLDKADGDTDGIPKQLLPRQYVIPWMDMTYRLMQEILQNKSDINPYGSTNKAEFFAVVAEYFFERPDLLQQKHPQLYELLQQVFKQDPKTAVVSRG